jgi:hypothetical protein
MTWISAYGCTSAAGFSTEELWFGLNNGLDHSRPIDNSGENFPRAYSFPNKNSNKNQRELLVENLLCSWQQLNKKIKYSEKLGIILASTKGFIDDVVWAEEIPSQDCISPILNDFIERADISPKRTVCVSNACTSGISALFLANSWIEKGIVEEVLLLAADAVGPFVIRGFQSLKVLTMDKTRPFSDVRSGFFLGEATAAILLTKKIGPFFIRGVGIDSEGYAVTRPSQSGNSLKKAIQIAKRNFKNPLDLILAHGTATQLNDKIEDQVFYDLFFERKEFPTITASKWSIGHTLATSGILDLILGCEAIKNQKVFSIANSIQKDPNFLCEYLTLGKSTNRKVDNFLVSSLGFGGLHASVIVERG